MSIDEFKKAPVLILFRDILFLMEYRPDDSWESVAISHQVETYHWLSTSDQNLADFHRFLWTFHGSKVQVSFLQLKN